MFGDLFSQRGDYFVGTYYAGHRKYLKQEAGNVVPENSALLPPNEFMTKRQLNNTKHIGEIGIARPEEKRNFHLNFQKKHEPDHEQTDHRKFKKAALIVKNVIFFEHFSSVHQEDWKEVTEAGVHLWVNKGTGEVSTVCPWMAAEQGALSNSSRLRPKSSTGYRTEENSAEWHVIDKFRARTSSQDSARVRNGDNAMPHYVHRTTYPGYHASVPSSDPTSSEQFISSSSELRPSIHNVGTEFVKERKISSHGMRDIDKHSQPKSVYNSSKVGNMTNAMNVGNKDSHVSYDNEENLPAFSDECDDNGIPEYGTGALVYERTELEDLFNALDTMK